MCTGSVISGYDLSSVELFIPVMQPATPLLCSSGTVVICGDFNSRCGCLKDVDGDIVPRNVIDEVKTEQGEALVSFLRSSGLCLVNERVGQDNFTCISSKGCSVVDYCLVFQEDLNMVSQFQVKKMSECEEEGGMDFEAQRVPDHSVLMWNLALAGSREVHAQRVRSGVWVVLTDTL